MMTHDDWLRERKTGIGGMNTEAGFCQCGCGGKTKIAPRTEHKFGWIKGEPRMFLRGHNHKLYSGEEPSSWKGGRQNIGSYLTIKSPSHPRAYRGGYILEHIAVAEKALGHYLPEGAEVHHVNENGKDNRNNNLVICHDSNYHRLLHLRLRALRACGNPGNRRCRFCKEYDTPLLMVMSKDGRQWFHRECHNRYARERRRLNGNGNLT